VLPAWLFSDSEIELDTTVTHPLSAKDAASIPRTRKRYKGLIYFLVEGEDDGRDEPPLFIRHNLSAARGRSYLRAAPTEER
jgi:hypothetical protein